MKFNKNINKMLENGTTNVMFVKDGDIIEVTIKKEYVLNIVGTYTNFLLLETMFKVLGVENTPKILNLRKSLVKSSFENGIYATNDNYKIGSTL